MTVATTATHIVIIFDIYKQFIINSIEMHIYLTQHSSQRA